MAPIRDSLAAQPTPLFSGYLALVNSQLAPGIFASSGKVSVIANESRLARSKTAEAAKMAALKIHRLLVQ